MNRWFKIGAPFFLLAAGGGGAYWVFRPKLEPVSVITTRARTARIARQVHGVGHVEPVTKVRVSANISGDLLALHVKEGDRVVRGALLAEIDASRVLARVRQAEAATRSTEAQVTLEVAHLDQAKSELKRATQLHGQKLSTDEELDRRSSDLSVIKARHEGARQRVEESKAALDEARAALRQTQILAALDGTVISLEKKVGERIRGSDLSEDVLLTLAPLHAMEVELEVSEQDIVLLKPGQEAKLEIDALDDDSVPGKVVEIASSAVIRNRGTEMETTSFRVKVALERIPERLRSGMTTSVSIVTDVRPEAVAVPIEAVTARLPSALLIRAEAQKKQKRGPGAEEEAESNLRREKPVKLVFVVKNGLAEPQPVVTGIASDADIEIVSGLEPGTEIVMGPYRALAKDLSPGSPLVITERVERVPAKDDPRSESRSVARE